MQRKWDSFGGEDEIRTQRRGPLPPIVVEDNEPPIQRRGPVPLEETEEEEPIQRLGSVPLQFHSTEEEEEPIQRKGPVPSMNIDSDDQSDSAFSSPDRMPFLVQRKMESSFGEDFSDVNIHKDSTQSTELKAHAFAKGNDIHFAPGMYNPESQKGQELLGHELTHVVQQRQGRVQPTVQKKGVNINDDEGLEKEADEMGAKAAKGEKIKNISLATASMIQKSTQTDENLGEAVTDNTEYYINNDDARIRSGASFAAGSTKIPSGCKIKRIRKGSATSGNKSIEVAYVEILDTFGSSTVTAGAKYWTSYGNVTGKSAVLDTGNYFVQFSDTMVYKSPFGLNETVKINEQTTNKVLDVSTTTEYTITEQCGKFVNIKQGSTDVGWIYKDDLASKADNDRAIFMKSYKDWLDERYTEITSLSGQNKLDRIEGILSQAERNFAQIENGSYPSITELEKEPAFIDNATKSITPHELVSSIRKFIVLTERTIEGIEINNAPAEQQENTEEPAPTPLATLVSQNQVQGGSTPAQNTNTVSPTTTIDNAGSLYSDRDWNSRLKVNQYRTQSDNLTAPEATCAATTFAMMVERMGYNRKDVIDAITTKLGSYTEYSSTDEAWKKKSKDFFNWLNNSASDDYQKIRGAKEGLLTKSKELGEKFKEFGQLEDLIHFYQYLLNNSDSKTIMSSKSNNDKLRSGIEYNNDTAKDSNFKYKQIWPKSWDSELRKQLKDYLDKGCVLSLSVYHKGKGSTGTHIISVQTIDSEGIILDDPYGGLNPDYRRTSKQIGDFYLPMGKDSGRNDYNYKNVPDYSSTEPDYTKRDFSYTAGQNLKENESRGDSKVLPWKVLNESDMDVIYYIIVLEPNKDE
ncbi:MAG: DUF4157 domain-containing protein [Sporocytophaga sp.]|nr:DUF4157 domain-containing protein [Sporocytophaga sp.]